MARCVHCGRETRLYLNGTPICLRCDTEWETAWKPPQPEPSLRPSPSGACAECQRMLAEHLAAIKRYVDVIETRKQLLNDGHYVSSMLDRAVREAESQVNEMLRALDAHRATHTRAASA